MSDRIAHTVISVLVNGTVECRLIFAFDADDAVRTRRSFCSMRGDHVEQTLSVVEGEPATWIVCTVGDDGYQRHTVEAATEAQAILRARFEFDPANVLWAQERTPDHVHVDTYSQDCDGRYEWHNTEALANVKGETLREKLGTFVGEEVTRLLRFGIDFTVEQHDASFNGRDSITVTRPGDEGGRSDHYSLCDDELCDEHAKKISTFRDHTAEHDGF